MGARQRDYEIGQMGFVPEAVIVAAGEATVQIRRDDRVAQAGISMRRGSICAIDRRSASCCCVWLRKRAVPRRSKNRPRKSRVARIDRGNIYFSRAQKLTTVKACRNWLVNIDTPQSATERNAAAEFDLQVLGGSRDSQPGSHFLSRSQKSPPSDGRDLPVLGGPHP
jgi:hypothetical protein